MLQEYRGLAIVFAVAGLALAAYFIKWVIMAPKPPPPPVQSVYVEVLPQSAPGSDAAPRGDTAPRGDAAARGDAAPRNDTAPQKSPPPAP
jgi:hypothetical protein